MFRGSPIGHIYLVELRNLEETGFYSLTCWETQGVLDWAKVVRSHFWDYSLPGEEVCIQLAQEIVASPVMRPGLDFPKTAIEPAQKS